MLTGTPLDLTPFGSLLTGIGGLYWLLGAGGLWWALRGERPWKMKLLRAAPIVLLLGLFPGLSAWHGVQQKLRLDSAMALFAERCKTAGEKIFRTVDNIEGVVWMKWREETSNADNYADQWKLNDPYGNDCGAEACIAALLRISEGRDRNHEGAKRYAAGYRFVETVDPRNGLRYRYTAGLREYGSAEDIARNNLAGREPPAYTFQFKVDRVLIQAFSSRYGITWDDLSTREDRERWIAGGSLKVIDLRTKEVLAERVGYMVDRGQGSQAGFRSPWGFAVQAACPPFLPVGPSDPRHIRRFTESRDFVLKVLHPSPRE